MAKTKAAQASQSHCGHSSYAAGLSLLYITVFYGLLVSLALHVFFWTPQPVPASAPLQQFSEARAREHVRVLTEDIGYRQVSTPGLEAAHLYLLNVAHKLQAAALARGDVSVEVDVENYDGDFPVKFMGQQFWNSYHNITNVMLHISRKGSEHKPAVMVVAHQDSPVSSQGAGDDASNVGVMLEMATNLLSSPLEDIPEHPVLFMFSGAEEPLCQSANAWSQFSKWRPRVGVFVNLESLGPGGVPIVFQHAGAWVIEAYARAAGFPRGSIAGQDVFDAGLVVGDTDFRQLSYRHMGGLPGLDIAYLLDGAVYHTNRDSLERLRTGVMQEMGGTLSDVVKELSRTMAAADATGTLHHLLTPNATSHKNIFFAFGGQFMLTYSTAAAKVLHQAPLALALTAPLVLGMLAPSQAQLPAQALRMMLSGASRALVSLLASVGGPAVAGALRAVVTGVAMPWFSNVWLAYFTYFPVALSLMLLPWQSVDYSSLKGQQQLPYHVLGAAALNTAVGTMLTQLGVGIGGIFSMWGFCGLLAGMVIVEGLTPGRLLAFLLLLAPPAYLCCETGLVLTISLVSRLTLTGHMFVGLGDTVAGVLLGVGMLSCTGLVTLPIIHCLLGSRSRQVVRGVLVAAVALALVGSFALKPYSPDMPKRLMLNHLHYTAPAAQAVNAGLTESTQEAVQGQAWPPMEVTRTRWALSGADSTPVAQVVSAMQLNVSSAQQGAGDEWLLIYPISGLLDTLTLPAPSSAYAVPRMPAVRLVSDQQQLLQVAGLGPDPVAVRELQLEIYSPLPCWGSLKVDGSRLVQWKLHNTSGWRSTADCVQHGCTPVPWPHTLGHSAGSPLPAGAAAAPASIPGTWPGSFVTKWTSETSDMVWPVTLRFLEDPAKPAGDATTSSSGSSSNSKVRVELHVAFLDQALPEADALRNMMAAVPSWVALTYESTTFVSVFEY